MGARLDLHTLRLFARTVELKTIAQAAAAEHIAASALSKRISDLEETLGTALLYRQRRGVEPTPAGLALLHHARQILTSVDALELDLAEFAQGVRGHVRMLANISSIVQFLPADLSAFARLHPDIKVDLSEAGTPAILKAVADGRADLGVIIGGIVDHGLATAPYREDRMVLVTPVGHPLAGQAEAAFAEALDYEFVGLHSDSGWEGFVAKAARDAGRPVRMRVRVPSFDAMARMVEAGLGISVAPSGAIAAAAGMALTPLSDAWARRSLQVCCRDPAALSASARLLLDHLVST
jgi:DNA-binding transcriptional LysR family regulator